jgi:PAS domain S-box-containing protein
MMYPLAAFSLSDMTACASALRQLGTGAGTAETVAQRIAESLYHHLGDSHSGRRDCALVRCFLTRPYHQLDPEAQHCVIRALGTEPPDADMPCLTLMGTAGLRPEWNSRERSRRYRALPLAGPHFVSAYPMFSQLLHRLGMAFDATQRPGGNLLINDTDQTFNVFHVPQAAGSPYVPAQQDFVIPYGIASVLGFGGVLTPGRFFIVILFSTVPVPREVAELFKPLALSVKLALLPFDECRADRTVIRVERPPARWEAQAHTLAQLLAVHEQTVRDHAVQQRWAEEALRARDEQYRLLVMRANDIIYRTDPLGRFTFVNPTAMRIMKYPEEELLGRRFIELIRADARPAAERFYGRQFVRKRPNTYYEFPAVAKDGAEVWIGQHVQLLREDDRVVGFQAVARDITERKRAEALLRQSEQRVRDTLDQVRTLTGRVATVEEEERGRIARELHDELGVRLSCLKIDLANLQETVHELPESEARSHLTNKIRAMVEQVEETIASVQHLVSELRPAILDDLGLAAAIEWQCQDFQRRAHIACRPVASAEEILMEPDQATALFRICQEALTNVARHAQARTVTVTLEASHDVLRLSIADDGVGIPEAKIWDRHSLGLLGMRERVARLGGDLSVQGTPGQGTIVTARLPRRAPAA